MVVFSKIRFSFNLTYLPHPSSHRRLRRARASRRSCYTAAMDRLHHISIERFRFLLSCLATPFTRTLLQLQPRDNKQFGPDNISQRRLGGMQQRLIRGGFERRHPYRQ
jgi:hypothetical protein